MAVCLRVILILVSVFTSYYVFYKIRKSQLKIEDALYWLFFSALILFLGFFPEVGMIISKWIGIESAANFVFLVVIFLLIIKVFTLSIKNSRIEYKLSVVIEELVILQNYISRKKRQEIHGEEEDMK